MAPVFKRKEMGHPDTVMFTRGSLLQMMVVVGSKEPGQPHSFMARPRSSTWELSGFDVSVPLYARGNRLPNVLPYGILNKVLQDQDED